jgi:cobyrinic acid a,c-diamide synthase
MLAAPSSGSGKTTVATGLVRAFKKKGYDPTCFKTGPDYIDTAFLAAAAGKEAGNLDLHLQGEAGMRQAFSLADGDLCVIEGAMGYFDGISNTWQGSSYHIAKTLGITTVMVYSPKGEMFSAVPQIKGMIDFSGNLIKAVILNNISEKAYQLLKGQIEKYTGVKVLGYLPPKKNAVLKSRHLGLVQSMELEDLDSQLEQYADALIKYVNLDAIIGLMTDISGEPFPQPARRNLTVAVAKDRAFSFYYRENLKLLEMCCQVIYFSPLEDERLPQCDLLYLGGGYPEVFRKELSANRKMLSAIKLYADNGGCIYAECGGMMYLFEKVEGESMVGIFKGESKLTDRLQRFGYIDITLADNCMLGSAGDKLTAHEFHRSTCTPAIKDIFQITKTMGSENWACGRIYKNVISGYPHLNFLGNLHAFNALLDYAGQKSFIK